ncbi:MAG: penicillin-binding protein 2 [Lentisphaerae bacterium]|nr:penicillin-binding protein 2 [Lentisphaerota bacterium]
MQPDSPNELFRAAAAFVAAHATDVVRGARFAFFILAGLFLLALWRAAPAPMRAAGARGRPPRTFPFLVLCFLAILAYQATWQLAGFTRPAFIAFMRRHSHRTTNPAESHARGRILDRRGAPLAVDDAAAGRRTYPLGPACAHLVGYADPMYGLTGIENADDQSLSGAGASALEDWRAFGQGMLDHARASGNDVQLTIDATLQARALELLAGRPGAVVGIRPADGAILIMASSPSFDPNRVDPARLNRQANTPMFNRALQGRYAPGSSFKIITACRAAEAGFKGTIDCPAAGYTPPGYAKPIRDHEYAEAQRRGSTWKGHGKLDLEEAFARSSNVFFARLGPQLGASALNDIAARFRFNQPIPIFTGSSGSVAADASAFPDLSPRAVGETAQVAIGQGRLAVTPLQMALVAAAIANGGTMMAPQCRARQPRETLSQATTPAAAKRVGAMMRGSVLHGTSRRANIPEVDIAGKTGTAQNAGSRDHSWFVCFGPYTRPGLALAVVVEGGGFGAQSALPIAVDVMRLAAKQGWPALAEPALGAGTTEGPRRASPGSAPPRGASGPGRAPQASAPTGGKP